MAGPAEGTLVACLSDSALACLCWHALQSDLLSSRRLQLISDYLIPNSTKSFEQKQPALHPTSTYCSHQEGLCCLLFDWLQPFFFLSAEEASKPNIFDCFLHLGHLLPDLKEYSRSKALSISLFSFIEVSLIHQYRNWKCSTWQKTWKQEKFSMNLKFTTDLNSFIELFAIGRLVLSHYVD